MTLLFTHVIREAESLVASENQLVKRVRELGKAQDTWSA